MSLIHQKRKYFALTLPALFTAMLLMAGCGGGREEGVVAQPLALPTPVASSAGEETTSRQDQNQGEQSSESQAVAQAPDTSQEQAGSQPQLSDEELISVGEEVYLSNCARCHQSDGEGTATYPSLANSPIVTDDDPANVIDIVVHGRNQMPGFGNTLPEQDIAAVVSFIRNEWGNEASVVTVEQLSQGQAGGEEADGEQAGGEQADSGAAQASTAVEGNSQAQAANVAQGQVAAPNPAGQVIVTQGQGGTVITVRIEIVIEQPGTSAPAVSAPAAGGGEPEPPDSSSDSQAEPAGEAEADPAQAQSSGAASDDSEAESAPPEEEATAEPTEEPTEEAVEEEVAAEPTEEPAEEAAGDEATTRLEVPEGFAINTYFSGLDVPRLMTLGPDGALYVAEQEAGAVVRLVDADGDGVAEERQVVAENLDGPHSVEWFEESLYVAEFGRILRLTDQNDDGDMLEEGEQETVTDNIPTGGNHTSRTLHFGPDGKIYVAAGSTGNNNVETDLRRATIMRFNLDGSIPEDNPFADDPDETRRPVWAEGLRNSVDFLFLPDGRLWATHNGSDMLGDDIPPEEIVIEVEKGQHYGWPYCYTPEMGAVLTGTLEVHDERVPFDDRLGDCSEVVPALFTDLAHQAPLGVTHYDQSVFPAEYEGSLFVAYHGSWNADNPRDCKVVQIVVQDGQPVESRPFVTGFRDSEEQQCGEAWGRPAGVEVGANGELFISDDQNGNIYRVIYEDEE